MNWHIPSIEQTSSLRVVTYKFLKFSLYTNTNTYTYQLIPPKQYYYVRGSNFVLCISTKSNQCIQPDFYF